MRESKLTEMLKGITPLELKKFGDFLNSPFHNKSRKMIELYDLINKHIEDFDANVFIRKKIAQSIFSGENNKDQNVRTLISSFTSLLEKFLVIMELEKSPMDEKLFLLKSLKDRNILKTFDMTSKEMLEISSKDFNKNTEFYYHDLMHKDAVFNVNSEDLDLNLDKSLLEMSENTDYLYIVTKLKILNTVLSRKIVSGGNIYKSFWGVEEILKFIEKHITLIENSHPTIYSEYKILMLMLESDRVKHFHDLEKQVFLNISRYTEDELEQVYYSLSNYCVNRIAYGDEKFIHELYKIHTNFEKVGFYSKNKNIQYTDFIGVIICGINLKQHKWVSYFFENYKTNIASEVKRDTLNLSLALISFSEKKYKDCIGHLSRVGYKYTYFYLKSKETLIKAYYELGEMESLEAVVDAAKHYIKRHKELLSIHYDRYVLFLNYVISLERLDKKHKTEIKALMKKLDENRTTIARNWLIEKIIELR